MAAIRIPGTLFSIWFVSPCPMKPAPTIPTRMGFPCSWRALSALSTMIMEITPCGLAVDRHPPLQLRLDLVERLPGAVLRGDFSDGQRPLKDEAAIVERQPAFGVRRVELADVVAGLGAVFQDLIPVREALRHVERAVVVGAELDRDVLQVRRALGAQVHDDVVDGAARGTHQLRLRRRRELEVHAAHGALLAVEGDVGLGHHGLQAVPLELALGKNAGEEPPAVLPAVQGEDLSGALTW